MTNNKVKMLLCGAKVIAETAIVQYALSELKPINTNGKIAKFMGFVVADAVLLYQANRITDAQ